MGRRLHPVSHLALFGIAIIIAAGVGWYLAHQSAQQMNGELNTVGVETPSVEKVEIYLYFGDSQGRYLTAEKRIIDRPADAVAFGRRILTVLLDGPEQGGSPTLPGGVGLRAFHISDGAAFVDFESGSFDRHPGGVKTELLSIYSIVNTLVLNVEEIRTVKILIGGQEPATLAGHVDLSHPFEADILRVR